MPAAVLEWNCSTLVETEIKGFALVEPAALVQSLVMETLKVALHKQSLLMEICIKKCRLGDFTTQGCLLETESILLQESIVTLRK